MAKVTKETLKVEIKKNLNNNSIEVRNRNSECRVIEKPQKSDEKLLAINLKKDSTE